MAQSKPAMQRFIISLLVFFGCVTASLASAQSETSKPNIIIMLADDLGYADLGFGAATLKPRI